MACLLFSTFLFLLLLFSASFAGEPRFVCEPADDWNVLLDRNEGWLAGDGIFSVGLDGLSKLGSANSESKTIFLFSDSFFGKANPDGSFQGGWSMPNHCFAILDGDQPDHAKMKFLHNTGPDGRATNLLDRKYWLGDGIVLRNPKIVNSCQEDQRPTEAGFLNGAEAPIANPGSGIDSQLYTTGTVVNPKDWSLEGPWMIRIPIENDKPNFAAQESKRVELFHKDGLYEVLFGIGITDCGDSIYVYGFRDQKGTPFFPRQLVVAQAPRSTFFDVETWKFWTGSDWSDKIADCNRNEAALAEGMSNELSVTKMIGGPLDGKFVLVYTDLCITERLNFAVSSAPNKPFSKPTTFYRCPEPKLYDEAIKNFHGPQANLVTYNAKAHPRFSKPGELLVSYNLNIFGMKEGLIFPDKKHACPRFVRLRFEYQ